MGKLDLPLAALFDSYWSRNGNSREPLAVYSYTDEDDRPLFEVCRFDGKDFRQRKPSGEWGIKGVRRVLYRLPRVVEAASRGGTVYVAEGEKDVHAIERVGAVATCNPMGAGKWRDEYAEALRGAHVVVIADRDEAGYAHARDVLKSVSSFAASVEVYKPKSGKDASDHFAAGHSLDFVEVNLSAESEPATETPDYGAAASTVKADVPPEIVDMIAAAREASQPIEFPCDPIAARGFVTVLAGQRSALKSWLATAILYAVHRSDEPEDGRYVVDMRCRKGRALYVDLEGGRRLMVDRFKLAGIPLDGFVVAEALDLHLPSGQARLRRLLTYVRPTIAVLDSLRRLAPKMRENESDDTAQVMTILAQLSREFDCAVVVIHHRSTKPGAPDMRGSSAIEDQADLAFVLERVAGDPDRSRRRLRCTDKYRIGESPPARWFRIDKAAGFVALATAEPYEGGGESGETTADALADRMLGLIGRTPEGGWIPRELAETLGVKPNSGTWYRALGRLIESGEVESVGQTSARRILPGPTFATAEPIGGDVGESESVGQLFASEAPPPEPPRSALTGDVHEDGEP